MKLLFSLLILTTAAILTTGSSSDVTNQRLADMEMTMNKKIRSMEEKFHTKLEETVARINTYENMLQQLGAEVEKINKQVTEPIAFSAYRDTREFYEPGETVIFGAYWANLGDAYDINTGEFRCPVSGLYHFSFGSYLQDGDSIALQLVRDGTPYVAAWSDGTNYDQGYMSAIIPCLAGDKVWLRNSGISQTPVGELTYYGSCISNSFTGFLLFEM